MFLGEVIKKYRTDHGISQQTFADMCGLSKPYISQLENNRNPKTGEPAIPSADTFVKVAEAMRISLKELLNMVDENQPISLKTISDSAPTPADPRYAAAAGEGIYSDGSPTDTVSLHIEADQKLVLVRGRSMEPTLQDGDAVVVSAQSVLDYPRQIALVKVNGEDHTIKRVEIKDDGLLLLADNIDVYPPHFYTSKEVEELPVTIEGVVVKLIREI